MNARLPAAIAQYVQEISFAATKWGVDALLLAAVMERESKGGLALSPQGAGGTGDNGHGRGLMQIDDRAHRGWIDTHDWRNPRENISYGAAVLHSMIDVFASSRDQLERDDAEFLGTAAYNCGPKNVRAGLANAPRGATLEQRRVFADRLTTGNEGALSLYACKYGKGVFGLREKFRLPPALVPNSKAATT